MNRLMDSLEVKDVLNELPTGLKLKLFFSQWFVWLGFFVLPFSAIVGFSLYFLLRSLGGNL